VGGGGRHSSLFMVVGTQHVICGCIPLSGGGPSTCLHHSFSWCDMATDGWGRGDMEGASHQPPVGSRQWWCCVSGVGGNRHGAVAYCICYKTTMLSLSLIGLHCMVTTLHSVMWPGSLMGLFVALGPWSVVFVGAGCCVLVVAYLGKRKKKVSEYCKEDSIDCCAKLSIDLYHKKCGFHCCCLNKNDGFCYFDAKDVVQFV